MTLPSSPPKKAVPFRLQEEAGFFLITFPKNKPEYQFIFYSNGPASSGNHLPAG
jgi:hypothetical protein